MNSPSPRLVRAARPEDVPTIAQFNQALALETEGRSLDSERILAGVHAFVTDPSKGRYWVAVDSAVLVGQLAVTYEWSDWRNGNFWWIQSVYVALTHRRRGVFTQLYATVEAEARAVPNCCGIRLYMEPHNSAARATYLRLGLVPAGYEVFETDFTATATIQAPGKSQG